MGRAGSIRRGDKTPRPAGRSRVYVARVFAVMRVGVSRRGDGGSIPRKTLGLNLVFFQELAEVSAIFACDPSGLRDVAAALLHHACEIAALERFDGLTLEGVERAGCGVWSAVERRGVREPEVLELDRRVASQMRGPNHRVFELSDVAGPVVLLENGL